MPTILTKKSDTPGAVPATANLTNAAGGAELAVNTADKRLFTINSSSAVVELGTNPGSLTCADASFTVARISSGTVTQLTSTSATVTTLTATSASVTNLTATSIVISNLSIASANITTLTSTNATAASLTVSTGNLTFSSTAQRITGDMSNATQNNRLLFQTSTTNGFTTVGFAPNGTGTGSASRWYSSSDADNASVATIIGGGGTASMSLQSTITGTGTYLPMTFYTGGSERMRLDTSGNLGIGTSSPVAGYRLNVVNDSGNAQQLIRAGTNFNSTIAFGDQDSSTSGQLIYAHNGDYMAFNTNAAERMRIDSSGNVGIGTTSPGCKLDVYNSAAAAANNEILRLRYNTSTTAGHSGDLNFANSAGTTNVRISSIIEDGNNVGLGFSTFNSSLSQKVLISANGNVGIGGTGEARTKVTVTGTLPTSGTQSFGFNVTGTIPSGTTSGGYGYSTGINTEAASFTLTELRHYNASQATIGAGSTVTNQYGFIVNSNLTGATNNYGFYSNIASGSNRWNFYAAGTADNYFAGRVFFTSTNATPAQNNVEGMAWTSSKNLQVSCEGDPLYVNRKGSDGALVNFLQDGTAEGSISVAGNTVSYNPFMGSHYTEIVGAIPTLKGTVLESLNELVNGKYSNQDRLPKAKVSDTVGSSAVYGVYFAPDSDPDTNDGILAAALGASWVRIAAGVTVQRGDLLESNGDGCAKVQSDDIIRSKTIGKVTSTTVADTYADGSYIVPCVLYCG